MDVFRRLLFVAAFAGLTTGIFITAVHQMTTVPIILEAETFEQGSEAPAPAVHAHGDTTAAHDHDAAAWGPQDGFERTAYTLLADVLTGIGFSLLLVAASAVKGDGLDWRRGLYWGLAGFAAVTLAPGLGLPPEVPGTEAAPLVERQIWWLATVVLTAGGLAAIFFGRRPFLTLAGITLIVLPHAYGAPQPAEHASLAPEELAHRFMVAATLTSLLFWLALGALTGAFYKRIFKDSTAPA